jgi:exosortase
MSSTTQKTQISDHAMAAVRSDDRLTDAQRALIGGLVLATVFTLVFWDFLHRQVTFALAEQADFGHTLVVPFIAGYLVYLNRVKLLAAPFRTAWAGLIPIVLGVAWYVFCSIGPKPLQHHNVQAAGVALTIGGLVLLMLGWRAAMLLLFPMCYLFLFGQYISERFLNIVTFKLQDITARGSYIVLQFFMDVDRSGNTLSIYHNGQTKPLNIAEACSGMRMLMAFLALGVFMAYTGLKHNWQRIALVLLAVPTAIFVNVLRVVTLGVLTLYDAGFAAGEFHSVVGLVWLVPAFVMFLGLMWVLRHMVVEDAGARQSASVRPKEAA